MLLLLQHMLWDVPDQKDALRKLITERIVTGGIDTEKLDHHVNSLKKIIDEEKEILEDEILPVPIYSKNDSEEITTYRRMLELYKNSSKIQFSFENPRHNYVTSKGFQETLNELRVSHSFSPKVGLNPDKRILYKNRFLELKKDYEHQKKFVNDTFDQMKKELESNIWITTHDIKEVIHIQQHILNKVHNLEPAVESIQNSFQE